MNSEVALRKASRLTRRVLPAPILRFIAPIVPARVRSSTQWMRGDVTMMSFPKSGRTWLRLMIGRALQQHFGTDLDESVIELHRLAEHDSRIPRIYAIHDGVGDKWRDPKQFRDRRIILLVRDPRDVIVSLYYQFRYRQPTVVGTLDEFVSDPKNVENLLQFYEVWSTRVESPDATLVLRYEDLHAEPERSLRDVLDFIGVTDVSDDVVAEAVEFARFDNMRQYEEDGVFQTTRLRPGLPGEAASFKTRRGEIGSHRAELPEQIVQELDRAVAHSRAAVFGYH